MNCNNMKYQSTTKYLATSIFHFNQINAFYKDTSNCLIVMTL